MKVTTASSLDPATMPEPPVGSVVLFTNRHSVRPVINSFVRKSEGKWWYPGMSTYYEWDTGARNVRGYLTHPNNRVLVVMEP